MVSFSLYGRGIKGEGNKEDTTRKSTLSPSLLFPPIEGGKTQPPSPLMGEVERRRVE